MREMLNEFREFIIKGNAFDLAVGVIIGAAFSGVVTSLVSDILMPPIGAIGGFDFSAYFLDLTALIKRTAGQTVAPLPSLDAAKAAGHAVIAWGKFLNTIINLLIVGFVIFMVVKQVNRLKREQPKKPTETPDDVKLLMEIRDLLARESRTPSV